MQETTELDQLSMTSEAARELAVAPTTLLTWDRTGKIRSIKTTNGRRLFPRSEIERVKREREKKRT